MNAKDWKLAQIKDFDINWYFKKNRFAFANRYAIFERIFSLISPKLNLDIGTADGEIPLKLVTKINSDGVFIGLDISKSLIKIAVKTAKKKGVSEHAQFIIGDVEHLPFREEQFDCVLSAAVLEHVLNLPEAVREIGNVIKEEKLVLITLPNAIFQKIFQLLAILRLRYRDSVYGLNLKVNILEDTLQKNYLLPIYKHNFVLPIPKFLKFMEQVVRRFKIKSVHLFLNQLIICKKNQRFEK